MIATETVVIHILYSFVFWEKVKGCRFNRWQGTVMSKTDIRNRTGLAL